jgi:hypothetical protein
VRTAASKAYKDQQGTDLKRKANICVASTAHAGAYINWDKGEPNNRFAPELCGSGDLQKLNQGAAYWGDENCGNPNIYICKSVRELPGARPLGLTSAGTRPQLRSLCFSHAGLGKALYACLQ